MAIIINLDVMLARRKMKLNELSDSWCDGLEPVDT
jgi:DNA-binding Xre family transcriptional regulator